MAYSPFRSFRKHQKAWLAALTILSMFVFILTGSISSGFDFFQGIAPALGLGGRRDEAAQLYGRSVTGYELLQLREQRTLANSFMYTAARLATNNVAQKITKDVSDSKMDQQTKDQLLQMLNMRGMLMSGDPRMAQYLPQFLQQYLGQLEQMRQTFAALGKNDEAQLALQTEDILGQDMFLAQHPGDYFGVSLQPKDLIDFLLWQHRADELGIRLSEEDINYLPKKDTRNALTSDDWARAFEIIRQRFQNVGKDTLRQALAQEFRVRLAKESLLGDANIARGEGLTPYEFWKFYQNQRTESDFVLLSIPVDSPEFIKKVQPPGEDELKTFFEENKGREPDPSSDRPGFKQPTRIRLEWLAARADSPFFRQSATLALAVTRATFPLAFDLALLRSYELERYRYPNASWLQSDIPFRISFREGNLNRVENLVGLIGQMAAPGYRAFSAPITLAGYALAREVKERAQRIAELVLTGTNRNPVASLAPLYAVTPRGDYRSLDEIKPLLVEKLEEEVATDLVREAFKQVQDYMTNSNPTKVEQNKKLSQPAIALGRSLAAGSAPGIPFLAEAIAERSVAADNAPEIRLAAAASLAAGRSPLLGAALLYQQQNRRLYEFRSHLAELVHRYHLEEGKTAKPCDRIEIENDAGVAPLRQAYERSQGEPASGSKPRSFASLLDFASEKDLYVPQQLPTQDKYLYWKTDEQPSYVPTFAEARPRVLARWTLQKARRFAGEEADEIAAEARKAGGDAERRLLDAGKHFGRLVRLDHVARLVTRQQFVPSRNAGKGFEPYRVPESDVEYPSDQFVEKLLALKDKGDVTVLLDKPETHYYVAALTRRSEPREFEFKLDASQPDVLLQYRDRDTRFNEKYRESVVEQMRKDARVVYDEDRLKSLQSKGGQEEE